MKFPDYLSTAQPTMLSTYSSASQKSWEFGVLALPVVPLNAQGADITPHSVAAPAAPARRTRS